MKEICKKTVKVKKCLFVFVFVRHCLFLSVLLKFLAKVNGTVVFPEVACVTDVCT